eukprot:scaffold30074_cov57-Phaeocystis_antarctica.AAC.1
MISISTSSGSWSRAARVEPSSGSSEGWRVIVEGGGWSDSSSSSSSSCGVDALSCDSRLQPLVPAHAAPWSIALGLDSGDRLDRLDCILDSLAPTGL